MNMATYETFAAVYDAVMDDSLYDLWTDFSLRHLPKSKDRKKLLELACGTGIQSVRFFVRLFSTFFKIGLFSIGGGYAILPMIKEQVVLAKHWLTGQEFTDIITISQMTPGPIAVNTSSFVGIRVAGIPGAVVATVVSRTIVFQYLPTIFS